MKLIVDLPEEMVIAAGLSGAEGSKRAGLLILLELYREGKIAFGKFAQILNISQAELLDKMKEHETYLNYSSEDLADDRETLKQ